MSSVAEHAGLVFDFSAELWRYTGKAAWYFISLPEDVAADIRHFSGPRRGFGSVRVKVCIGKTEWQTSIFPDSKRNTFILPVKAAVRKGETIDAGETVKVTLALADL